jgi:hypothetical protein
MPLLVDATPSLLCLVALGKSHSESNAALIDESASRRIVAILPSQAKLSG